MSAANHIFRGDDLLLAGMIRIIKLDRLAPDQLAADWAVRYLELNRFAVVEFARYVRSPTDIHHLSGSIYERWSRLKAEKVWAQS